MKLRFLAPIMRKEGLENAKMISDGPAENLPGGGVIRARSEGMDRSWVYGGGEESSPGRGNGTGKI